MEMRLSDLMPTFTERYAGYPLSVRWMRFRAEECGTAPEGKEQTYGVRERTLPNATPEEREATRELIESLWRAYDVRQVGCYTCATHAAHVAMFAALDRNKRMLFTIDVLPPKRDEP